MTDRCPRPPSGVATERSTGQERVLGALQVAAERAEALANERQLLVAKEILEHLGGSAVEGVQLAERDRQAFGREDEYSCVLEGRMGALLGGDVLAAGPGDLVLKPRNEWHTFWNAGEEPCRILEIIAPAGFERFFAELADLGGVAQADPAVLGRLCERHALEMDPSSIPDLVERFGVRFPAEPLVR